MSRLHCRCGFAIDEPAEFGDHLREAFTPPDDTAADGQAHYETSRTRLSAAGTPPAAAFTCPCGLATDDITEFDDHFLLVFPPPDATGQDGRKHGLTDTATPDRWHLA